MADYNDYDESSAAYDLWVDYLDNDPEDIPDFADYGEAA